jgi:hypothetical protein
MEHRPINIKKTLKPEEFEATGLSKLGHDELEKLNAWLYAPQGPKPNDPVPTPKPTDPAPAPDPNPAPDPTPSQPTPA